MATFDYEYILPNAGGESPFQTILPSAYPKDTPAGMRGEAVRSALRSGRCICWNLGESPIQQGWLSLRGKGVMNFLNNKLTTTIRSGRTQNSCLLNPKGKAIDQLIVASLEEERAFLLTSPGHLGSRLFGHLDPLIFPLDQVSLNDVSKDSIIFTLASTKIQDVKIAIESYVKPLLELKDCWSFPKDGSAVQMELMSGAAITILPTAILPEVACSGYTLVLTGDEGGLFNVIWRNLVSEDSPDGPIEIGPLEFETLRIEAGMPAYGKELTGDDKSAKTSVSPLELHWGALVDMEKGCYLGQEGVAAVAKNKRGPPRLLYSVVFEDEGNIYEHESSGDRSGVENLTKLPREGQELFVLGSNEQVSVGVLTSVAEPSGTGDAEIRAMAMVKRADSILKSMRAIDLKIDRSPKDPFESDPLWNGGVVDVASVMVQPPPLDPLDGLEVIVGGTFTVGTLRCVPSRRLRKGENMFLGVDPCVPEGPGEGEVEVNRIRVPIDESYVDAAVGRAGEAVEEEKEGEDDDLLKAMKVAEAEVAAAAAEAERKAQKLEMLKKRAEEALARRKAKSETTKAKEPTRESEAGTGSGELDEVNEATQLTETERKAKKMEMLQKRAEEAMARRRAKERKDDGQ